MVLISTCWKPSRNFAAMWKYGLFQNENVEPENPTRDLKQVLASMTAQINYCAHGVDRCALIFVQDFCNGVKIRLRLLVSLY